MNTTNILTHTFSTPFESAPFSQIKQEDFEPAILELINQSKTEIANIVNQSELPNFKNTIEALEASGKQLNRATAIFFNLNSAETNDYLEQVAQKLSPALAAYSNDIMLNATLFNKIKKVYDVKDTLTLTHEQKRLLDKTYKSFVRNGALLSETDKERLRNIDQELSMLSVQFSQTKKI
jgi:peptidyl-dipeptidase Dcp